MNDKDYAQKVSKLMSFIVETIESKDQDGEIDIDINGDVLNITTAYGVFVINRQPSVKEVWLSSPVSGPYHFGYKNDKWISKSGEDLFLILSQDLKIQIKI